MESAPISPVVTMLVPFIRERVRLVMREGQVIVRINKTRRDHAIGAVDSRCGETFAVAPHARNNPLRVHEHPPASICRRGPENRSNQELGGASGRDFALSPRRCTHGCTGYLSRRLGQSRSRPEALQHDTCERNP
jgi:hypothetical protein